jgi:D-cysteine desulfhydrase
MALPRISERLNAGWVGCKRDDLGQMLHGGTKVRKLDFMLAAEPCHNASAWVTPGAIGSGHVVACCAAAEKLGKKLEAFLFWEEISDGVTDNLAYIASHAASLHYYPSRTAMILSNPSLLLRKMMGACAVIPFGATNRVGILGTVHAGLELAMQVRNGELPEPARIYAAMGSSGTVAGLAIGVALGGLRTHIHAVAVVEPLISTRFYLNRLMADTRALMSTHGISEATSIAPAPIHIDRTQLGKGYGHPTRESLQAVERMAQEGITIEPVYTGKTVAAMWHDLENGCKEPVLFWNSMRRQLPEKEADWTSRLPQKLKNKLYGEQAA